MNQTPKRLPSPRKDAQDNGLPIGRLLAIFGIIGLVGVVFMGARQLVGSIAIVKTPIVGEWRAANKPWRILFRADQTVVSSTGPSRPEGSQTWTSAPGTYKVDYFGTLWIKLENGESYTASLPADRRDRFDLIDSRTEGVTEFERGPSPKSNPLDGSGSTGR